MSLQKRKMWFEQNSQRLLTEFEGARWGKEKNFQANNDCN